MIENPRLLKNKIHKLLGWGWDRSSSGKQVVYPHHDTQYYLRICTSAACIVNARDPSHFISMNPGRLLAERDLITPHLSHNVL